MRPSDLPCLAIGAVAVPGYLARLTGGPTWIRAPRVVLEATHENVLRGYVPLSALKRHALDLN
jgi:uncharacterized protein (DUF2237 family)